MAITKIWAANGIKSPIPATPQGDNLVNYDEGFTTPYRTPIKDGGVPIGMGTFNQLMFDITDEIIQNKSTLNQVAQQINSIIDDTQTNLTSTWSSQLIDNKLSAAVAAIIDDNQTTSTLTWSSLKIQAEIGQASAGGGNANIDDDTISTDKVWSSFKTNEMVKGGRTISISNLETTQGSEDTTIANTTANAKMVNLSVKVKTNATTNKYLGDVVVYYNDPSKEILRQSCVSQNIADATELTTAIGMTILDAQDSLLIQSEPASGVIDFWNNVTLIKSTSNVTGSAPVPEPLGEGLIFTAQASSSSVTFNKKGTPTELQLEYQTTLSDVTSGWQDYTLGTRVDLSPNDKVSFRNKGTQTITQTSANYHYFTMAGEIKAENDLTYLFSSTGGVDTIAEYGCYKMFSNCSALTEMPDLSATNIGANGYANMFEGCTKLKTSKPLPATTLANRCYNYMFYGCTSLTTAPSLPATTLADECYKNMFQGCTSLTTAPSLPATTLVRWCYYSMFEGCTSLTTAPSLPATTLANDCYSSMFRGCTSLTTAPSLRATTLTDECYEYMFQGCTSLTTAPSLPATTLAYRCYYYMFQGCTKLKVNQNGSGNKIFTCPSTSGIGSPVEYMFTGTGGSFRGDPTQGNTYNWYN